MTLSWRRRDGQGVQPGTIYVLLVGDAVHLPHLTWLLRQPDAAARLADGEFTEGKQIILQAMIAGLCQEDAGARQTAAQSLARFPASSDEVTAAFAKALKAGSLDPQAALDWAQQHGRHQVVKLLREHSAGRVGARAGKSRPVGH